MKILLLGGLGVGELVLILVIVLIIFGAGKLPQIGDALGKGIRNFKKASTGHEDIEVTPQEGPAPQLTAPTAGEPVVEEAHEVEKAE
jgi:sec-independent protein translocase protein TatA